MSLILELLNKYPGAIIEEHSSHTTKRYIDNNGGLSRENSSHSSIGGTITIGGEKHHYMIKKNGASENLYYENIDKFFAGKLEESDTQNISENSN